MKNSTLLTKTSQASRTLDAKPRKQLIRMQDNRTSQMKFTAVDPSEIVNNYQRAAEAWSGAALSVGEFCQNYDQMEVSVGRLEENILGKSLKACTTCAGESYEPRLWGLTPDGYIIGPGGQSGVDLKKFKASSTIGVKHGEVKSSNRRDFKGLFRQVPAGVLKYVFSTFPDSALLLPNNKTNLAGYQIYDRQGAYRGFLPEDRYDAFVAEVGNPALPVEDEDAVTEDEADEV